MSLNDNAGAYTTRVDKSQAPANLSPSSLTIALAIHSQKGFINVPTYVSDLNWKDTFFLSGLDARKWGTSANELHLYLQTKNDAYVARAGDASTWRLAGIKLNDADDTASTTTITPVAGAFTQSTMNSFDTSDELGNIVAFGEGTWGNSIYVEFRAPNGTTDTPPLVDPSTGINSRISVCEISYGSNVVEKFYVTRKTTDQDPDGKTLYWVEVLKASKYVRAFEPAGSAAYENYQMVVAKTQMTGGVGADGTSATAPVAASYKVALKSILDYPEKYDVHLAINAGAYITQSDFNQLVVNNGRCVASTTLTLKSIPGGVTDLTATRASGGEANGISNPFLAIEAGWGVISDDDTLLDVAVSNSAFRAVVYGNMFKNDTLFYAPAGAKRGVLTGCKRQLFEVNGNDRIKMTAVQINPIKVTSDGFMGFWDTLTSQTFKSAFSDLHASMSYIFLDRAIVKTLDSFSFDFNDQETVTQCIDLLNAIGGQAIFRKGLEDFVVNSNNNILGSDEMILNMIVKFKGIAKKINVRIIAIPSTGEIKTALV